MLIASTTTSPLCRFMLLIAMVLFAAGVLVSRPAMAALEVDITRGQVEPMPIALPNFIGATPEEQQYAIDIVTVIGSNLERSGLFRPLPQASYIEQISDFDLPPRFEDWRAISAQALVSGRLVMQPDGRLRAEFRLWDVFRRTTDHRPAVRHHAAQLAAHGTSDLRCHLQDADRRGRLFRHPCGLHRRGGAQGQPRQAAGDDGPGRANVRHLSDGKELVVTPRFSPTTQQIAYMSFAGAAPRVYVYDIETNQRQLVGEFPNMSFAPRFSPDGRRVIMSLQDGGNSDIYVLDLNTRETRYGSPTRRPSTLRRHFPPTAIASCSNPTATAPSRSM
jgi:TolB protein